MQHAPSVLASAVLCADAGRADASLQTDKEIDDSSIIGLVIDDDDDAR